LHEQIASLPERRPADLTESISLIKSTRLRSRLGEIYCDVGIPMMRGSRGNKRPGEKATL
jgi:hypothetical protein